MIALCIYAASTLVRLPVETFTLAWTHSIEKVRWEEDYRVEKDHLAALEARVKGSAAGMEPPAGAVLRQGWWHYMPPMRRHAELRITRSPYAQEYEICTGGSCRSLAEIAPQANGVTRLTACAGDTGSPPPSHD